MIVRTNGVSGLGKVNKKKISKAQIANMASRVVSSRIPAVNASLIPMREPVVPNPRQAAVSLIKKQAASKAAAKAVQKSVVRAAVAGAAAAAVVNRKKKKKGIVSRIARSARRVNLKTALKVAAGAAAVAVVAPGVTSLTARALAKTSAKNAVSSLAKKNAAKKAFTKSAARLVKKNIKNQMSKNLAAKNMLKIVNSIRKKNAKTIAKRALTGKLGKAVILAGAGGAAAVLARKAINKRMVQQYAAGAGAGEQAAPDPAAMVSVTPVANDSEVKSVNAISPAELERKLQNENAQEIQDTVKAAKADANMKLSGINPMIIAGIAAAAFVLPGMMKARNR